MPLPLLPIIAAAQAGYGLFKSYQQQKAADRVKVQDTRTQEERDQLGLAKQEAANPSMPGYGMYLNQAGAVQANTLQNARLGAGSGADLLAAGQAAAGQRQRFISQLGVQQQQYRTGAIGRLGQAVAYDASRQRADLDTANRTKAALIEGSDANFGNALNTGANYAAVAYNANESALDRKAYGLQPGATTTATGGAPVGYGRSLYRSTPVLNPALTLGDGQYITQNSAANSYPSADPMFETDSGYDNGYRATARRMRGENLRQRYPRLYR